MIIKSVKHSEDTVIVEFTPEFSKTLPKRLTMTGWAIAFWKELEQHLPFDLEAEQKQIKQMTEQMFSD